MPWTSAVRWALLTNLCCAFTQVAAAAVADAAWFARAWQSDDGLPENNVTGVVQMPDGYLWVATPSGLARFDGVRFEEFSPTNFPGVPNRVVRALLQGRSGRLWLAMDRGPVVRLDGEVSKVFTASNGLPDLLAQALVEDNEGALWITYYGGAVVRLKADQATSFTEADGLPGGSVCSLAQDRDGRLWFAKGGQVGARREDRFQIAWEAGEATVRLAARRAGGVWICTGHRLFWCVAGGTPQSVGVFRGEHAAVEPTVLLEDGAGSVWIGTSANGLFRFDGTRYEAVPTAHAEIVSLTEDREGNLWVGTGGGGLNRVRPQAFDLERAEAGLPFESVSSICQDAHGEIWATTQNGQLVRRAGNRWALVTDAAALPGGTATCVAADRLGGVWIGTREGRLLGWKDGRFTAWDKRDGLEGKFIRTLQATAAGDLWIGEEQLNSLQCLRAGQLRGFRQPSDARFIRAMAEDSAGNVWAATSKGVLLRIAGDQVADETDRIAGSFWSIRCLHATPDGALWIGYAGWGVGRWKAGRFARITAAEGLFDDYISEIIDDGRGWLWFGANHGLFKVRQKDLEDVAEGRATRVRSIRYGRGEGLPSLQANYGYSPGALRSRDGRLWLPMRTALVVVDPEKLHENPTPPPVLVERVSVDGRTVAQYAGLVPNPSVAGAPVIDLRKQTAPLHLAPAHRKLDLDFTALSFAAPENVQFRYRLEGFDESWIEAGNQRHASYPRLPAGDYRFRVKACNNDGVWNEQGAVLTFQVSRFVWQTWWFRFAVLAGFTTIIVASVRYLSFRSLRLKLRELEQQAALHKERARIAKDIHDDLGGSLTQISLLSELAFQDRATPDLTAGHVRTISTTARQVIKSLDEIVWAVNPRNDTLPQLIDYTGQYAVEFLRAAAIRCRVDLPEHPAERAVPAEVRHNLFLAVKEALSNVARHAHATEVSLRIAVTDTALEVTVADNGQGFAPAPHPTGADGLGNMRQRMEEVGGQFSVEASPGHGTQVCFVLPLPPAGGGVSARRRT